MNAMTGYALAPQQRALSAIAATALSVYALRWQSAAESPWDFNRLAQQLDQLLAQEEILRTRLHAYAGMPEALQVIEAHGSYRLEHLDWSALANAALESALDALAQEATVTGLIVAAVDLPAQQQALILRAPAVLLDSISLARIARLLLEHASAGEHLQYADYAAWRESLVEDPQQAGPQYWQQYRQRQADLNRLQLRLAAPQMDRQGYQRLPLMLARAPLAAAAGHLGISVEALLYLAWAGLLARLLEQPEVAVQHFYPSRGAELAEALGAYGQWLALALPVDPEQNLAAQAAALLQRRAQAERWADYCAGSERAAFAYQALDRATLDPRLWQCRDACDAAVLLQVIDGIDSIQVALQFDRSRFSSSAMSLIAEQLSQFLHGLGANPGAAIERIGLFGPEQQSCLAHNQTELEFQPLSVVELFQQQAREHPQNAAIAQAGVVQDYARLNQRANQLAHFLCAQGIGPGRLVALVLSNEVAMPWVMLAVLKTGAAYVPLDADYPAARIQQCLQASGAQLLIARQGEQLDRLAADFTGVCLSLEMIQAQLASYPSENLAPPALDELAYVIYTSGSTGQPKGVAVSHRALSHSTQARLAYYSSAPRAYLMLSSFAFDSSAAGLFWSWAAGACLVLPEAGETLMPRRLLELIQLHQVSHGLSLPALWQALLEQAGNASGALHSLRAWIVAGEACAPAVLAQHQACLPQVPLYNEYGPTEATVWASVEELDQERGITIGRPTPGMRLALLNRAGQAAAIGECGEIYLGGAQLAEGYYRAPALTAERFVSLDLDTTGGRYYRTGDLAAWRADGRLDFLGRRDQQVKLRGYRIELADLENTLSAQPGVAEAAARVYREGEQPAQLVAYVVASAGQNLQPELLQQQLAQHLPAYLLPQSVVVLEQLPRSANGKLDRHALPAPQALQTPYVAPRNAVEASLTQICGELLKRPQIGVNDNFFQLGGDSILSLQLVSRALHAGIELSARQVFETQTIAGMAAVAVRVDPARSGAGIRMQGTDRDYGLAATPAASIATGSEFALDDDSFAQLLDEVTADYTADYME